MDNGIPIVLAPYDKPDSPESAALGVGNGIFGPFGTTDVVNKFMDPNLVTEWQSKYAGKPDITFMLPLASSGTTEQRLIDKWNETFVKITIGEAPLSAYDDYLTWLEANGGKQLTQEANDLYTQQFKK
jgi:putative aldouronate transport system substrate-binding protein